MQKKRSHIITTAILLMAILSSLVFLACSGLPSTPTPTPTRTPTNSPTPSPTPSPDATIYFLGITDYCAYVTVTDVTTGETLNRDLVYCEGMAGDLQAKGFYGRYHPQRLAATIDTYYQGIIDYCAYVTVLDVSTGKYINRDLVYCQNMVADLKAKGFYEEHHPQKPSGT